MRYTSIALIILLASMMSACGGKKGSDAPAADAAPSTKAVDSTTAADSAITTTTISSGDLKGASVTAQPGTLATGSTLSVAQADQPASFAALSDVPTASSPLAVSATDQNGTAITSVSAPLTIAIPVSGTGLAANSVDDLCVLFAPSAGGSNVVWRRVDIDVSDSIATFSSKQLGIFQLFFCGSTSISGFVEYSSHATWTLLTTTDAPSARVGASAVALGHDVMIWGGVGSDANFLNTGAVYNMTTKKWTAISTTNAPEGRANHGAVAISSTKAFIWGGATEDGYAGTGAIYNVTDNTWTTVSTTSAPSARRGLVALWTGTYVIVWSGKGSDGVTNSGMLYDPAKDTWSAMVSSDDATPKGRENASAVWTGSVMLAYGGNDGSSIPLASGGIYDPSTKAWTATTSSGAPGAVTVASMVWTGSKAIHFGGFSLLSASNAGIGFTPSTKAWSTLSTTNGPAARGFHQAVYSQSRMLIFHGAPAITGNALESSVFAYDPSTDTWETFANPTVASKRVFFSAAALDDSVLVWGGCSGSIKNLACVGTALNAGYTFSINDSTL